MLASLARRAEMVAGSLNSIPGLSCNTVQGAMYAFPRIMLPDKVGWEYGSVSHHLQMSY